MKKTYQQLFEERKDAKFLPKVWVEYRFYDCVTFSVSMKEAHGDVVDPVLLPYRVFGKGDKMLKQIRAGFGAYFEETDLSSLTNQEKLDQIQPGDVLVFSKISNGHHCGVVLEDFALAHCSRSNDVQSVKISGMLVDHLLYRYR